MLVSIQGRKIELTPALKSYALEKVSVLNKYLNFNMRVHVTLSVEKFRQRAEVAVSGKGAHLRGMEETEDMYASIDKVMDKLARQARRFKEKRKDHHAHEKEAEQWEIQPYEEEEDMVAVAAPSVIREQMDLSRGMSAEEAITILSEENRNFVVYKDIQGDRISVVYHRPDGNIGLIET